MSITVVHKVSFGRPSIGPRHYISLGGSGWPETFLRTDADEALKLFVGRLEVHEMVNNFLDHIELKQKSRASWTDVTAYLARILRVDAEKIPMVVGVAFWARVVMIEEATKKEGN